MNDITRLAAGSGIAADEYLLGGAISIESPVRRLHGESFDFAEMQHLSTEARHRGIGMHLDGALFDTVQVSLWKCFNAARGALWRRVNETLRGASARNLAAALGSASS